jgi:hypothetical protein
MAQVGGPVSNHARHRRRHGRTTKIRGIAWMDLPDAQALLEACDCPAIIVPGEFVYVQHMHRHACPALKRWPT